MELEHALLRCPWESLNATFRTGQKLLDKEISDVLKAVAALSKTSTVSASQASNTVDKLMQRLLGLKRKLEVFNEDEVAVIARSEARFQHVAALEAGEPEAKKTRLARAVVEQLLRSGLTDSAEMLAKDAQVGELVELELYKEATVISAALKAHDSEPALQWCHTHRSRLRKAESKLEFQLRLQQVTISADVS
eukprot:TRINITY_DN6867_c0_g1_i4.p1 TRINITY_DN6867_c0_g1~~TRINITY_DN6867_c0_g1_i4.p1  ORF type:complete len:193 (+),score=65.74 TRINITY_DN6867_c0_g1_i4:127-705(+)